MKYNTQVMNSIKDLNQACDELEDALSKMKRQKTAFYNNVSNGTSVHNTIYNELSSQCKRIEKYLFDVKLIRDTIKSINNLIKDTDNNAYKKLVGPWYKQLGRKIKDVANKVKGYIEDKKKIVKDFFEKCPLVKYTVELLGDLASIGIEILSIPVNFVKYGPMGFVVSGYNIANGIYEAGQDLTAIGGIGAGEILYNFGLIDEAGRESFIEDASSIGDREGLSDELENSGKVGKVLSYGTRTLDTASDIESLYDSVGGVYDIVTAKDVKNVDKVKQLFWSSGEDNLKKTKSGVLLNDNKKIVFLSEKQKKVSGALSIIKDGTKVSGGVMEGTTIKKIFETSEIGGAIDDFLDVKDDTTELGEKLIEANNSFSSTPRNYCIEPAQLPLQKEIYNRNSAFSLRPAYRIN